MGKHKRKAKAEQTTFVFSSTSRVLPLPVKVDDRLVMNGHEKLATALRDRAERIAILQGQDKKERETLAKDARSFRMTAEKAGDFHKTVVVPCETGAPITVEFGNSFKDIDVEHESKLRSALGEERYLKFFERLAVLKVRDSVTLAQLKETLGDRFEAFLGLVDVSESIAPRADFMEARAGFRASLDVLANQTLDDLIDQVQSAPSIKTGARKKK